MSASDGNNVLTGSPLLITGVGANGIGVTGNYYPPFAGDTHLIASLSTVVPGEYIQNAAITNPVKVTSFKAGAIGLLGDYVLSGPPNASGAVGSSGSQVVFLGTTITDGGAIAPGPALTILDQGPFPTFPITNFAAKTGTIALWGTYDPSTLGGTPTGINVIVSASANGPALAGCTPCNNGPLTSVTISAGKWSGTLAGIPAGGPYSVRVAAANGLNYVTMASSIKVGWVFADWGNGQADAFQVAKTGANNSWAYGLLGFGSFNSNYTFGPSNPSTANNTPNPANYAGDRFGVTGAAPISEGVSTFDQTMSSAYGVPAIPTSFLAATRDGYGAGIFAFGNTADAQTVGVGDGSTLAWCSASKFCAAGGVSPSGPLVFDAGGLTGGWFTGTVTSPSGVPTLTATTRIGGALYPGMVLSTPNAPTLVRCLTSCASQSGFGGSTWLLSSNADNGATGAMRADPPGGALDPHANVQAAGGSALNFAGFGSPQIKAGTFAVKVDGSTVCSDSQTFAWNQMSGACTGTFASGFINYVTGDYQITFISGHAPASGSSIIASWTAIISPEPFAAANNRPQNLDYFGDAGGPTTGAVEALFNKAPGGINGHIYSAEGTDYGLIANNGPSINNGYQFGAIGYSELVSGLFDTKFPALVPGAKPDVGFFTTSVWRVEGAYGFTNTGSQLQTFLYDQWAQDVVTKSLLTGHISAAASASVGTLNS